MALTGTALVLRQEFKVLETNLRKCITEKSVKSWWKNNKQVEDVVKIQLVDNSTRK